MAKATSATNIKKGGTDAAIAKVVRRNSITSDKSRYQDLWTPQAGPQSQALDSLADELFYGGAAGGGKSELLLGMPFLGHKRTIIFRRTYTNLKALIERSREIYTPVGTYNTTSHTWRLQDGRIIEFGSLQYEDDKRNYQGSPHDCYCFDEITEFTLSQYLFVTGWARTTTPGQRVRTAVAGNPPTTADGEWVLQRWAPWLDRRHPNPAKPGELRWFAQLDGKDTEVADGSPFTHNDETIVPRSRTFVPARLADNKYLRDTGYKSQLQALPEPLRSQLLNGDFYAAAQDDAWQCIPTAWVLQAQARWARAERPTAALRAAGVDVSRGGHDATVVARLYANWIADLDVYSGTDITDGHKVADLIRPHISKTDPCAIDVVGVGSSPYDILTAEGYSVIGINNGAGARSLDKSGKFGFANVRAESYWRLREALDPTSGEELALPPDRQLLVDLCAARFKLVAGRYALESKDDIRKRLGRSPDRADAVVMAWYAVAFDSPLFEVVVEHQPTEERRIALAGEGWFASVEDTEITLIPDRLREIAGESLDPWWLEGAGSSWVG